MLVTIKDNRTYYDGKNQGQATQGEVELMAALMDYENSITWQTSCTNCAKLMDKNYEEYVKNEKLREALKQIIDIVSPRKDQRIYVIASEALETNGN